MRMWRNRQTRMIQVHVGDRGGSSPFIRTNGWRHHFSRKTKQFTLGGLLFVATKNASQRFAQVDLVIYKRTLQKRTFAMITLTLSTGQNTL